MAESSVPSSGESYVDGTIDNRIPCLPMCCCAHVDPLYASESAGSDESGRGTEDQPFKTILQVNWTPSKLWITL